MALTKATLIDLNANELILDLDADTSITADSDDTIDFKIGGSDEIKMTTTALTPAVADGSALGTAALEWADLFLADASTIQFGADQEVTLTHVHNTGLLLNSTMALQFNDASQYINAPSATILDINATDEIELNATLIDINGNLDVSGTITIGNAAITEAELEQIDGITAGTALASKALIADANIDITGLRNLTTTGTITSGGIVTGTGFTAGSAVLAEAELELLDGLTAGTAIASKVVTTDANIDTTGQRNLTITGVMTGATIEATGDTAAGDNAAIGYTAAEGLILTGQGSTSDITLKNDADATVFTVPTGTDDILFPDSAKILMGAGSDLQLYHDGTNSIITDAGDGELQLITNGTKISLKTAEGDTLAAFNRDGDSSLRYDNSKKIATTATGVQVTGTALATTSTAGSQTGSVTLDFAANQNFVLTMTGNVTLANPTTEQVGQSGIIVLIQDGTGSRTLAVGDQYFGAGGEVPEISTAANAIDVIPYFVQASGKILLGAAQLEFADAS